MKANLYYILHTHANYKGKRGYIIVGSGHESAKDAKIVAEHWPYGDVRGDFRIVKGSKIKKVGPSWYIVK